MASRSFEEAMRVFKVQVESISGTADTVIPGEVVTFSVDNYNYTTDEIDKTHSGFREHLVFWYVEVDEKQDRLTAKYGETIEVKIKPEWAGKEIRVIANGFFTDIQASASHLIKVEKEDENYNGWEINREGHITRQGMHRTHTHRTNRLYAVGSTEKYLELKNSDALEELAIQKTFPVVVDINKVEHEPMRFAIGSPSDLVAIFLFASDNTDREWYFCRYNAGNGDQYAVGTIHETHKAITPSQMGIDPQKEIASIHSHPNEKTGQTEKEFISMGWRWRSDEECDRLRIPRGTPERLGDSERVESNRENLPVNKFFYVYIPHSGNIYRVRGFEYPEFIINIQNHNNDPTRLFWGVLNGR
jgi:hypothetical protein